MKLTKGKIARLHKTNRQSVKKQKWNKKHRNVKNLMSLNQKIPSHLANKSMKKYKKGGGELVQYGGELSSFAIKKLREGVESVTLKIMERSKINNAFLNKYSLNYAEFMCQIYNQPNYNINTLKKASNEVIKIVGVKQVNIAGAGAGVNGFITACSDGTISRFDINWVPLNNNITNHNAPITAIEILSGPSVQITIVTGGSDGLLQIHDINANTYKYVDFSKSSMVKQFFYTDVTRPIISIIASQDNNHVIVTYCKSVSESGEKEMVLSSYNIINNQRVGESLFSDLLSKIKSIVLEQKLYNFYYSTNIRSVVSNFANTRIAICRDHVVDIVEVDTRGVVLESGDNNKTLLSKFLDGFHVASFCTLNNNLIACGCKSVLTIWNYALPLNTRVMETPIFKLTLLSDITSILFTNNTIYCGLKNGAIQVNTYVYDAHKNLMTLTNKLANLDDIYWLVGHLDSVNSIFTGGLHQIYSCSDDGTVRQWNIPAPPVASVNSVIRNFSNPMLNLLTTSPFLNINFSTEPDDQTTVIAVTDLVRTNAVLHSPDYLAYHVDFGLIMNSLRIVDLTLISQSLTMARRDRFQKEAAQILKQTNGINDQNADAASFATSVNANNSISQQDKATKIAEYNIKTNKTIQSIVNKHNIEMDNIYDEFLKLIASIFNRFISDETRRLKTSMESVKTIVLNYVYKCIFNAVDTLNKYYIQEIEAENGTTMVVVSRLMEEFVIIKQETKEQIGDTIWSSQSSWWKSLDNIEKSYSETDENDPEVILGLSQQSPSEIKRKSLLLEAEKQLPSVKDENLYFYQELMWAYGLIGELINKIKLYNLDTDQFDIYQDLYKSNNLYPEEVLDILCQTDVLSDRSYEEISKFAFTFQKGYGFSASHFDPMTIHNTPEALNFTYYIDEHKVIKPDAINEFIRFAKEEYIAVPTREMLITLFHQKRDKLLNENPGINANRKIYSKIEEIDEDLLTIPFLQKGFMKETNITPTQAKGFQEFKKSLHELQKLYLQNQIFYMRNLSKTFQMTPSPRSSTPSVNKEITDTPKPQTNVDINSWQKLKNILLDPSNPRSDDTFQRWFKVLRTNMVFTEKELFDMTPGALDKLKADSTWNDVKNKVSGKLGFIDSLNRARLNREILKKDDNGKLINEKFLQQILENNKNPRSFERYTELKDILNKNGFTTEGSLSLLTDDVISKLDTQFQPLMKNYLKGINPAAAATVKNTILNNTTPQQSNVVSPITEPENVMYVSENEYGSLPNDMKLQIKQDSTGNYIVSPDATQEFIQQLGDKGLYKSPDGTLTKSPPSSQLVPPQSEVASQRPGQPFGQQPGQPPGQQPGQPPKQQPGQQPGQPFVQQPPGLASQPGPLVLQQSSQLTNEQIGKATEILINEIAYKIGPIINNMPYGEQQNTSVVAQAAQALAKGVYNHITNVQPPQPLNATTTSFMPNSQQLVTDASELNNNINNNINNNDELLKELISNLNASVEKNQTAAAEHNELLKQLIVKSNTTPTPNPELQTQIDALKKEIDKDKEEAKQMSELLSKAGSSPVSSKNSNISPTHPNDFTRFLGDEQQQQQQGVTTKSSYNKEQMGDIEFVHKLINTIKLPWIEKLKQTQAITTGGQRGGGLTDITDINNVLICYASRLQRLDNPKKDNNTHITKFEINHGLVEKWHEKKTGNRKVNVIPIKITDEIDSINDLYKSDKKMNSDIEYKNILYVKFLEDKTTNPNFNLHDETNESFLLVSLVCLEEDTSGMLYKVSVSDVSEQRYFDNFKTEIKKFIKQNPNITTIKFLVNDTNINYVQPEFDNKPVEFNLKDDNIGTLNFLRKELLFLTTMDWDLRL